jgi:hypothetical protein
MYTNCHFITQTCAYVFSSQKHQLSGVDDLEKERRIGCGVTGEVFQLKHKRTGTSMAAKVLLSLLSLTLFLSRSVGLSLSFQMYRAENA